MRPTAAAACAALLVLAVGGCAAAPRTPPTDEVPSETVGVHDEGSYVPLTSGSSSEPTPDEAFLVASSDQPQSATTTRDGRTLFEVSEPGYVVLLEPEATTVAAEAVVGTLQVVDGCLEVALEGEGGRTGAVLDTAVGMGPDSLVVDGSPLPFGERLDITALAAPSLDDAPASYRAACPSVVPLLGVGR